jgi:GGDEF domain-containing protein
MYDRLVNPESVLYPGAPLATWVLGTAHLAFRLLAISRFVSGVGLYVRGARARWPARAAAPIAILLAFVVDLRTMPFPALVLAHGPFAVAAYGWGSRVMGGLPPSRRSFGTRLGTAVPLALAVLTAALVGFYAAQRVDPALTSGRWLVRFARYGFYLDLGAHLALAYAMVRLLFEDARREADDSRAQMALLRDRARLGDVFDPQSGLLARSAFAAAVGLDFARASFGTVARLRLTNLDSVGTMHGSAARDALVTHFAGVLASTLRTHDRVYRWSDRDFLAVLPRARPAVARARLEHVVLRAAPLVVPGVREALRAEVAITVAGFSGDEDLDAAVRRVNGEATPALAD